MAAIGDVAWKFLAEMTLKSTVLILAAGIALPALRKSAAAVRHLVLLLLLTALLALPLLSLTLPYRQWSWPLRASHQRSVYFPSPSLPRNAQAEVGTEVTVPIRVRPPLRQSARHRSSAKEVMAPIRVRTFHADAVSAALPVPLAKSAFSVSRRAYAGRFSPLHGEVFKKSVLAIWLFGGFCMLLRLSAGLIGANGLRCRSERVTEATVCRMAAEIRQAAGIGCGVTLLQTSEARSMPVTWGLLRPHVLLPTYLLAWPPERLRTILLHEMAHIRRYDWLAQLLAQTACVLYWFHPLVWWAASRLREEGERACDDWVLLEGVAPSVYADTLMEVLHTMQPSRSFTVASLWLARPPIEKRLRAILAPRRSRLRILPRLAVLSAGLGTAVCVLPLASLHVGAAPRPMSVRPSLSTLASGKPMQNHLPTHASKHNKQSKPALSTNRQAEKLELALLHEQVDKLTALMQEQQSENRALRRRLQALQAQQKRNASEDHPQADNSRRTASLQSQRVLLEHMLKTLQDRRLLLLEELKGAQAAYQNGVTSIDPVVALQTETEKNALQIRGVKQRLTDMKSGPMPTQKEMVIRQLQRQLMELEGEMKLRQQTLQLLQERYRVGTIPKTDLLHAQQRVAAIHAEIDDIRQELLEMNAER